MVEVSMRSRLSNIALLSVLSALPYFASGCTSESPSGVTGTDQPDQSDIHERLRWTDDKGRYHPEWQDGINRPVAYPKNVAD
jgi:hypothetical protein